MSLTLTSRSHKLENLGACELSHHSHQLLQPSGQSAVLQVSRSLVQFLGKTLVLSFTYVL